MTILQASIQLFDWFKDNNSFSLDDSSHLKLMQVTSKEHIAAFSIALERLEKIEIIKGTDVAYLDQVSRIYVLEKNMGEFNQNINLSGSVAGRVAACINSFCEKIKDDKDLCDPINVTEKDVLNLCLISDYYTPKQVGSIDGGEKDFLESN